MTASRRLALFDLDHTLIPLDSDYQWAEFMARSGRIDRLSSGLCKSEDFKAVKARMADFMAAGFLALKT